MNWGLAHMPLKHRVKPKGAHQSWNAAAPSLSLFKPKRHTLSLYSTSTWGQSWSKSKSHLFQALNGSLAMCGWIQATFPPQHFLIGSPLHLGPTIIIPIWAYILQVGPISYTLSLTPSLCPPRLSHYHLRFPFNFPTTLCSPPFNFSLYPTPPSLV